MNQIRILKITNIKNYILEIEFSDNCIKQFDFMQIINFNGIAEDLKNLEYFKNVKIIDDGRAFEWQNGYDCCADWARYFAKDLDNEWQDYDDNTDLKQRIKIAKKNLQLKEKLVFA